MSDQTEQPMQVGLRALTANDAEAFMEWGGDPLVTQSLFWDAHTDLEVARLFLKNVAEPHPWFKAILYGGRAVGAVSLDKGKGRPECRAELGYVIARKYWGLGIASLATQIALQTGFDELGVSRIEAFVDPENLGSVRVLEKATMKFEVYLQNYVIHRGRTRDRKLYAATKI